MTVTKNLIIANLQESLRQFGLNPKDWRIHLIRNCLNSAEVRHRRDPDLKLRGHLTRGQWSQLEFLGI